MLHYESREDHVRALERAAGVEDPESETDHEEERELKEHGEAAANDGFLGIAQIARGEEALDDELVRAVRGHGEEGAADHARPDGMRPIETGIRIYQPQLPGGRRAGEDLAPPSLNGLPDQDARHDAAEKVDPRLEKLGPHHRLHAALVGVEHSQRSDDQDRQREYERLVVYRRADDERHRDRGGEHADRIGERSRDHENDRREASRGEAEALLEHRVRGHQLTAEVAREEYRGDHEATDDVPHHDLQETEIAVHGAGSIRQPRRTDERESARFRGDDREHQRPPRDAVPGHEVVCRVALAPAQEYPEGRDAEQVDDEY